MTEQEEKDCQHVWMDMHSEAMGSDAQVCLKCGIWRTEE